jgi:hypothetical protein
MSARLSKKQRRMLGKAKGDVAARAFAWTLRQEFDAFDRKLRDAIERSRAHDAAALDVVEEMAGKVVARPQADRAGGPADPSPAGPKGIANA